MITQIKGLHHVTSMAANAQQNSDFFTKTLGLRRVKKTVNFDAPDVYHLYYGDAAGSPGSVMTYFPFPNMRKGRAGVGEVGETEFAVPKGTLKAWAERLSALGVSGLAQSSSFGENRLRFDGPDGDGFALVEVDGDARTPWEGGDVPAEMGIHGFHGARMRVHDKAASVELMSFMGYEEAGVDGNVTRLIVPGGNGADRIDIEELPSAAVADQGAGSVHHIAFAVEDRAAQLEVRKALLDTGYQVTPVIDRDYFWAIYFRTPGGVLFEVATNEPGFDRDEAPDQLGQGLMLPTQHEHLRSALEARLMPITD